VEQVGETEDLSALLSLAALNLETYKEFSPSRNRIRRAFEETPSPVSPEPSKHTRAHRGTRQWNTRYGSRWSVLAGLSPDNIGRSRTLAQALAERLTSPLLLISSLSGGVGKTTIIATLARCLAMQHERVVLMETSEGSLLPFHFGATRLGVGASENFVIPNSSGAVQLFNVASLQNSDGEDDRPQRDSVQHDFVSALVQAAEKADRLFVSPTGYWPRFRRSAGSWPVDSRLLCSIRFIPRQLYCRGTSVSSATP